MKVLLAACITPFLTGGADHHIAGLTHALRQQGHQVVCLRVPFRFSPPAAISAAMQFCDGYDVDAPNGVRIDRLLSLQFPAYGLQHRDHRLWLMHQHRAAYDLYDARAAAPAERALAASIRAFDNRVLPRIPQRWANSRRVAERLAQYNGISSTPLYHPPYQAAHFFCAAPAGYVFYPSRLEDLKRQDLLIAAARYVRTPVRFLLAGSGGQYARYRRLIDEYALSDRVRLLGEISEAEKRVCYAHALAVFYGPRDEDYGYVTLEAMLASKPVITCSDSGGPLELLVHGQTGLVVAPAPEAIAEAIDRLYLHPAEAAAFGRAGRAHYQTLGISWDRVVAALMCP